MPRIDPLRPCPTGAKVLVVGLGATGLSCARYLRAQGCAVAITDSRPQPPALATVREEMPDLALMLGGFDAAAFAAADQIVLSPGVPRALPLVEQAARRVPVIGDIELFARAATAPVIAITGSNGKSTVTTLVGLMAREAGLRVAVGGNLGTPALDLLASEVELYVLELSSFQLETTDSLRPRVATVLNLSPDHLDRYADFGAYVAAKQRIFARAASAVVNRDDPAAMALAQGVAERVSFGLNAPPGAADLGIVTDAANAAWIARGNERLMPVDALRLVGTHNLANALAACALLGPFAPPAEALRATLRSFPGLPHRCEWIGERHGVRWINDSKGTNPGATMSALAGIGGGPGAVGRVVLIAGGDGKGADFSALSDTIAATARALVLIGRDAPLIEAALRGRVPTLRARDMSEAVALAAGAACPGDSVLLSPACASFDMFDDYRQRGRLFAEAVLGLDR